MTRDPLSWLVWYPDIPHSPLPTPYGVYPTPSPPPLPAVVVLSRLRCSYVSVTAVPATPSMERLQASCLHPGEGTAGGGEGGSSDMLIISPGKATGDDTRRPRPIVAGDHGLRLFLGPCENCDTAEKGGAFPVRCSVCAGNDDAADCSGFSLDD